MAAVVGTGVASRDLSHGDAPIQLGGSFIRDKEYRKQVEALAASDDPDRFTRLIIMDKVLGQFGWSDEITQVYRLGALISMGSSFAAQIFAKKYPTLFITARDYSICYTGMEYPPANIELMQKVVNFYTKRF